MMAFSPSELTSMLKKVPLFSGLPEAELTACLAQTRVTSKRYEKGELVARQNERYDGLLIALTGSLRSEMINHEGKTVKVESINVPGLIAPAVLFASDNRLPVNVTAADAAMVLRISRDCFRELLRCCETLSDAFWRDVSDSFRFMSQRFYQMSTLTLEQKILAYLQTLSPYRDGGRPLDQSIQEWADYCGVSRPSLSRTLAKLESNGDIEREGDRVWVRESFCNRFHCPHRTRCGCGQKQWCRKQGTLA